MRIAASCDLSNGPSSHLEDHTANYQRASEAQKQSRSGLVVAAVTALVSAIAIFAFPSTASAAIPDADGDGSDGAWSELGNWPLIPIHSSVLDDGKVLSFRGTGDSSEVDVWDPALGLGANSHTTTTNTLGTNLFCTFALDDPNADGKLLIGGETSNAGRLNTFTARYDNNSLSEFAEMNNPRWYPTVTTLWDGRLLAQGGVPDDFDGRFNPTTVAEVYSAGQGWTTLEGTRDPGVWDTPNYGWWYPKAHVTPAGKVWSMAWNEMYYIDPDGAGGITNLGTFPGTNYGSTSASVMYDTGLVLQVGGGERASDDQRFPGSTQASIVNLNNDPPTITNTGSLNSGRHWADATVLPDGKVLVTGGSLVNNSLSGAAYTPELWDPATNTWTELAANSTPRLYHSSTLLLPDGSVWTGGGGTPGPVDNFNAEVFYPPYLYNSNGNEANRPYITSAPRAIGYNQNFTVSSGPDSIDRVTLIKQANSTHSMSTQIFQELSFTQNGNQISIDSPDSANVATPGEYLLFLLDGNGVPSVARTVRLSGSDDPGGGGTISGTVTRDGNGAGAAITVDLFEANADGSRGQWLEDTTSDSSGNYSFTDVAPGCYVATFIAPNGEEFTNGSQWLLSSTCIAGSETDTLNAVLAGGGGGGPGTISGAITRQDGGVAVGVDVDLFTAQADGSRGQWLTNATSNSSGNYSFTDVAPGCYVLTFIAPNGEEFTNGSQWFQPSTCIEGGETDTIGAVLTGGGAGGPGTISGTVNRSGGGVGAGVVVDLFTANADGSRGDWQGAATTNSSGNYSFSAVEQGCYVLTFIAPSGETFTNGSQWFQPATCIDNGETDSISATLN